MALSVEDIFSGYNFGTSYYLRDSYRSDSKYMEIPINDSVFEIPTFALNCLLDQATNRSPNLPDAIVVKLDTLGKIPRYKSLDRFMQDVMLAEFMDSRLIKLNVKNGDDFLEFYGTQGAVFNRDFEPLMICLWQMERERLSPEDARGNSGCLCRYKALKPIVRINPEVVLNKSNPMERWIAGKMLTNSLKAHIRMNHILHSLVTYDADLPLHPVVEICESPFIIRETDTPSVSTTNEQLLQVAIDHIEEIMQ